MPGQATRYTTAQRNALVSAVLDEGKSQLEALRLAADGELAGLKAFGPVARGTLQGYLRQAMKHRKREIQTNAEELRAKLLAELWEEIELTIPGLKGAEKIARIRQAASAIDALERKPNRTGRPTKEEADNGKAEAKPDDGDELQAPSIARLAKAAKVTAQPDPHTQDSGTGTPQPSVASQRGDDEEQETGDGAGGRAIAHVHDAAELDHDQAGALVSA